MRMGSGMVTLLLIFVMGSQCFGQSPAPAKESYKYRTIGTLAGGGGGFTLGTFAGIAFFDDAVNGTRKVWTTALLSAAGGAVGGYFLGRIFDKRHNQKSVTPPVPVATPDEFQLSLMQAQAAALIKLGTDDDKPK